MKIHIAILSSHGFGDGLIQLVIARNFAINGFTVSYYNDFMAQLDTYIDGIGVFPFPEYDQVRQVLEQAHFILYDENSQFIKALPEELECWFTHHAIAYSLSASRPRHKIITVKELTARCPPEMHALAERMIRLNRSFRGLSFHRKKYSFVAHLAKTVCRVVGLQKCSHSCVINIQKVESDVVTRRIVIHPTSSSVKKNWTPQQFEMLALRLVDDGWLPVFTVSPGEYEEWRKILQDRIELKAFNSIRELARYYQTSVGFIGNDSGNAHLASCLGLPNLVIFRRWRKYPVWRPGWKKPYIVFPRTLTRKHWQRHLSVDRVYREFNRMMCHKQ